MVQERGGVGADHPLGERRTLRQQVPGPEAQRRAAAHPLELVDGGHHVEERGARDTLGMVEGQAVGDAGATIVADDREALVAERRHELDDLCRQLALGVALAARPAYRRLRGAVATQVRHHDAVGRGQGRCDLPPADVRLREAVQEQDRRPVAHRCDEVARLADRDERLHGGMVGAHRAAVNDRSPAAGRSSNRGQRRRRAGRRGSPTAAPGWGDRSERR